MSDAMQPQPAGRKVVSSDRTERASLSARSESTGGINEERKSARGDEEI